MVSFKLFSPTYYVRAIEERGEKRNENQVQLTFQMKTLFAFGFLYSNDFPGFIGSITNDCYRYHESKESCFHANSRVPLWPFRYKRSFCPIG